MDESPFRSLTPWSLDPMDIIMCCIFFLEMLCQTFVQWPSVVACCGSRLPSVLSSLVEIRWLICHWRIFYFFALRVIINFHCEKSSNPFCTISLNLTIPLLSSHIIHQYTLFIQFHWQTYIFMSYDVIFFSLWLEATVAVNWPNRNRTESMSCSWVSSV